MRYLTQWKRAAIFLAAGLAALAAFWVLSRFDNKYTMRPPLAQDGAVEVGRDIFVSDDVIWLSEGWELYPDVLLQPGEQGEGVPLFLGQYPTWSAFHADASPYGQATYRLRLRWEGEAVQASLYLPEIFCVSRVYVNGALAGSSGRLAPYEPLVRDLTVSFPLEGETELLVQTANHSHYYSGMTYPPALGSVQGVARLERGRTALYAVLSVAALTMAVSSAALWLGDRKDRLALWLAGLTVSYAVRIAYPLRLLAGTRLVALTYAVEDAAAMAGIWFALRLALELWDKGERPWARGLLRLALGMTLAAAVVPVAVLPGLPAFTGAYGALVSVWKLASALVLAWASVLGGVRFGAAWLSAGAGVYAVGLVLSVSTINQFEPARGLWPDEWGALALVLCFAGLMVGRSLEMVRENRRLSRNLSREVDRQTAQIAGLVDERQQLLSEFLHDLKSPLSSVLSYARVVLEHDILLDDQTRAQLSVIEEKSGEMARQLKMMQQFTLQNPMASHWELVELSDLLEQFYRRNRPDVEANGPDFLLELPGRPCPVRADRHKLFRALQNLVFNALSFTPQDGAITLSLTLEEGEALVAVRDTGCGIPPQVMDKLFQRGFTTRAEEGGEGLGLYIVKTVAQEHGGGVEVDSAPGGGAVFTIRLPLAQAQ